MHKPYITKKEGYGRVGRFGCILPWGASSSKLACIFYTVCSYDLLFIFFITEKERNSLSVFSLESLAGQIRNTEMSSGNISSLKAFVWYFMLLELYVQKLQHDSITITGPC